jgi:hypothetical protein
VTIKALRISAKNVKLLDMDYGQGCQMAYFQTKYPKFG